MIEKIINNFIYEKKFKNTTLKDIKDFYWNEIKYQIPAALFCSSLTALFIILLNIYQSAPFLVSLLLSLAFLISFMLSIFFITLSGISLRERFFCLHKIKKTIEDKNFCINLLNIKDCPKYHYLNGYDFIASKGHVLKETLNQKEIEVLTKDLIADGIEEKDVKDALKDRLKSKENIIFDLDDFCFISKDLKKIMESRRYKEREVAINNIVDNIEV